MNSLALCSLCLFLIAQSPWLTNATVFGDGSDLIGQICNENPEKKIECTNILRADPTVLGAKNLLQLSEAILNLAVNKTEKAEDFLKGLANTTDVPAIANCALYYENAVERFMNSLQKLKCQDLKVANYLAAIAGDEPSSFPHFHTNKKLLEEVAIIPSKRLRNKIAGFSTASPSCSRRRSASAAWTSSPPD
uniref:Pectinesterase inhibitor domain-containing protein n=1 Tax=Glycine max TaxID=3847 RepID=K7M4G7_SOYBN